MSTLEEVKAAERRMNEAKKALQRYTERSANEPTDHKLHLRLAQELKRATDDYLASVINLKA
jgi:predicted metal-dependent hydrolase